VCLDDSVHANVKDVEKNDDDILENESADDIKMENEEGENVKDEEYTCIADISYKNYFCLYLFKKCDKIHNCMHYVQILLKLMP
jgi:hypothetical protein